MFYSLTGRRLVAERYCVVQVGSKLASFQFLLMLWHHLRLKFLALLSARGTAATMAAATGIIEWMKLEQNVRQSSSSSTSSAASSFAANADTTAPAESKHGPPLASRTVTVTALEWARIVAGCGVATPALSSSSNAPANGAAIERFVSTKLPLQSQTAYSGGVAAVVIVEGVAKYSSEHAVAVNRCFRKFSTSRAHVASVLPVRSQP